MPKPSTPSDDSAYKNQESSSEAQYKDWNPLQYGLSKVMCDLFCIHDSVTAGTSAVLQNMEKSQDVLTKNLQKLLNYQTEYILWAIGTVVKPHSSWSKLEQVPSVTELMQELRRLPKSLKSDGANGGFSRELLDWHQDASDLLLARIAVTGNQTSETWPYRIHAVRGRGMWRPDRVLNVVRIGLPSNSMILTSALKGMLHHFSKSLQLRLLRRDATASVAQKQIGEKLQVLRQWNEQQRSVAERAKGLRLEWLVHDSGSIALDVGVQVVWVSLLEGFLRVHEKHATFTMLRLQVSDAGRNGANVYI